ncbi:4935_t:CDS:2, partial [Acaulospora morrowiae]
MPETTMISASHWLENAIDQEYLNFHDFDKFSDLVPVGDGPLGKVYRAQWQIRGMVVALKSWIDETSKEEKRILDEFMNEVNTRCGRPPFQTSAPPTAMSQIQIATRISNGEREEPVKDSP